MLPFYLYVFLIEVFDLLHVIWNVFLMQELVILYHNESAIYFIALSVTNVSSKVFSIFKNL